MDNIDENGSLHRAAFRQECEQHDETRRQLDMARSQASEAKDRIEVLERALRSANEWLDALWKQLSERRPPAPRQFEVFPPSYVSDNPYSNEHGLPSERTYPKVNP